MCLYDEVLGFLKSTADTTALVTQRSGMKWGEEGRMVGAVLFLHWRHGKEGLSQRIPGDCSPERGRRDKLQGGTSGSEPWHSKLSDLHFGLVERCGAGWALGTPALIDS